MDFPAESVTLVCGNGGYQLETRTEPESNIFVAMILRQLIQELASVYHTTKHDGQEFAVKVFKDRDRNTQGHYHSRLGNFKSNSRKIVKTWAENEMRRVTSLSQ
ncbi:hypothetical protein ACET3Z_008093 [Daucus carota]